MQTIIKTSHASNFTILANDLINSDMPPIPYRILSYLLSKPVTWQLKPHDLRKQLGLSAYAIKKGLRWLCSAGFAAWHRLNSGHTIWRIFDKPQVSPQGKAAYSPVFTPQVEKPQVENRPVLIKTKTEVRNKPLPAARMPEPDRESIVVVSDNSDLIYPSQLTDVQKKAAKHIIKKAPVHLQQDVLFALAYAMAQNKVKSAPAYLQGLVTRANNGTFEAIQPTTTAINQGGKPLIPIWQGFGSSSPSKPEVASGFINQAKAALRGIAI
jgi:hypothetical protein